MTGLPQSLAEYRDLLTRLARSKREIEGTEDYALQLEHAISAQEAVISFLNCDREGVAMQGLAGPLALIRNALVDAGRGANPRVLDHQPKGPGTKPTGLVRDDVRAQFSYGLELLITSGMKKETARQYIANEAAKLGIRDENGGRIQGKTIEAWRYDWRKRKSPKQTLDHIDALEKMHASHQLAEKLSVLPPQERVEYGRERVRMLLINLANLATRTAPAPRK
jgi:hypothetical protein